MSTLLLIDPAMKSPAIEAVNCVASIMSEFRLEKKFSFTHFEYFCPYLNKTSLASFIANKNIGACICLGSHANVTENHPFVESLTQDLNDHILLKNIPFLGICFSHQLIAHIHEYEVGFLKNRDQIPSGKHHHFRQFEISHPKLAILATTMKPEDYFSDTPLNIYFQSIIQHTKNWNQRQWEQIQQEEFIQKFIDQFTLKQITAQARHEQEILKLKGNNSLLVKAATSMICEFEAFVHSEKPIYSFQTHLETDHPDKNGYLILKNFIYTSSLS
jgi:GMP synthase-like glutamine amidotransferase